MLLYLILYAQSHILFGYENTTNTIWLAAGGGVSGGDYNNDGGLFLDCASISAASMRVPDDNTDNLAAGSDLTDHFGVDIFVFSGSKPNHCSGCDPAVVASGWNGCGC